MFVSRGGGRGEKEEAKTITYFTLTEKGGKK